MKTCVLYARYSDEDRQDVSSIADQFAEGERLAKLHGYKIVGRYKDEGISGDSMLDRPGIQQMMLDVHKKKFDAVIVLMVNRLSRSPADTHNIFDNLKFRKITLIDSKVGVVQKININVEAIVNSQFQENLRIHTFNAMTNKARQGLIPGKTPYGYRGVLETLENGLTRFKPGVREIFEDHAKIVRRIFNEYANGSSPRAIAAGLTRDGIRSPSGNPVWSPNNIIKGRDDGMIGNQLYIGKLTWNKNTHEKYPGMNKYHQRKGDPNKLIETDMPHLRIIDQTLWDRAQAVRQSRGIAKFGEDRKQKRATHNYSSADKYILVGMLRCGSCNGNMVIGNSNMDGSPRVVCSSGQRRMGCEHTKSYCLKILESTVLDGIQANMTDAATFTEITKGYHARWAERQKTTKSERVVLEKDILNLQTKINRIVDSIADTESAAMRKSLTAKADILEAERAAKVERLDIVQRESNVVELHPKTVGKFCESMTELHDALKKGKKEKELVRYKAAFRNVFEAFYVNPTGKRKPYSADPLFRLAAVSGFNILPTTRTVPEMLAEQGYSANGKSHPLGSPWVPKSDSPIVRLGPWIQGNPQPQARPRKTVPIRLASPAKRRTA